MRIKLSEAFYYRWRKYFGWMPVQFCVLCGKPYWGGFPRYYFTKPRGWFWPWMQDYCSKECADEDMELVDSLYNFD